MVFWKAMLTAELASAIGTLKWHEGFLPALLTVHDGCVTLFLFRRGFSVYMFPPEPGKMVDREQVDRHATLALVRKQVLLNAALVCRCFGNA